LNEILFSIDKITGTYYSNDEPPFESAVDLNVMKRIFQWICGLTTIVSHVAPLKIMAVIILQTAANLVINCLVLSSTICILSNYSQLAFFRRWDAMWFVSSRHLNAVWSLKCWSRDLPWCGSVFGLDIDPHSFVSPR